MTDLAPWLTEGIILGAHFLAGASIAVCTVTVACVIAAAIWGEDTTSADEDDEQMREIVAARRGDIATLVARRA